MNEFSDSLKKTVAASEITHFSTTVGENSMRKE